MAANNESVNDGSGRQRSGQQTPEQGRTQQQTINESGKDKQWLAKMRVKGQWLVKRKGALAGGGIAVAREE